MRASWLVVGLFGCAGTGSSPDGGPDGGPTDIEVTTKPSTVPGAPTWYQDVAPLLADRCGGCHQAGGAGPFTIATYEDALPWGPAIAASLEDGSMPPFYAVSDNVCDMGIGFLEDISLSQAEKDMVYAWVAADMPEGDKTAAAPAPLRPVEALDYDVELQIQEPFAVSSGEDVYMCMRVPLPNTEDRYLTGVQVVPGNDLVVHHVIVWNDPNDNSAGQAGADGAYPCSGFPDIVPTEIVSTWTPGSSPIYNPPNTGTLVEAGSSLVLNIHYHGTGTTTEFDQTKIQLQWTDVKPPMYATWFLVDLPFGAQIQPGPNDNGRAEFRIPAGASAHQETVQFTFLNLLFSADMTLFGIVPHMHFLGTDMLVDIIHVDDGNDEECLVHSPGFRFDQQRGYYFDPATGPLPVIHRGDRVRVQCLYDNSASNPFLADHLAASGAEAPHDVTWGDETGDEMCMAILGLIVPTDGWSPFSWF